MRLCKQVNERVSRTERRNEDHDSRAGLYGALDAARPLTIERKINEPSICQLWLSLPANGSLAAPSRFQTLAVTGDDGTIYFTGYIAVSPLPEYAGMGLEGPRYRTAIQAVSDELLLDQMLMPASVNASGGTAGALLAAW